jgi:hypothetical protein
VTRDQKRSVYSGVEAHVRSKADAVAKIADEKRPVLDVEVAGDRNARRGPQDESEARLMSNTEQTCGIECVAPVKVAPERLPRAVVGLPCDRIGIGRPASRARRGSP